MFVEVDVRFFDGEVGAFQKPCVRFAAAVNDRQRIFVVRLQNLGRDSPEVLGAHDHFQDMGVVTLYSPERHGFHGVFRIAHLDDAPKFAGAFFDPNAGGIAPHAFDAFATHEFPFAGITAHHISHDVTGRGTAQIHAAVGVWAAVGDANGDFFPAFGCAGLYMHAAAAGATALPRAQIVARRNIHVDGGVVLDVGLPVIAGATEARFFFGNASVSGDGAVAAVFGEYGVRRRKAVAVFADTVVGIAIGTARGNSVTARGSRGIAGFCRAFGVQR